MTRCDCDHCRHRNSWFSSESDHCHDHHHEDTRWAIPVLGVFLALAAVGLVRAHAREAEHAAALIGYGTFGACAITGALLIAWRARRRRAARQRQAVALDTWTRAGQLPGGGPGPQAIGSARDGRQAPALPASRRTPS